MYVFQIKVFKMFKPFLKVTNTISKIWIRIIEFLNPVPPQTDAELYCIPATQFSGPKCRRKSEFLSFHIIGQNLKFPLLSSWLADFSLSELLKTCAKVKSGRINSGGSQLFPPLSFARFLKCYFQGSTSTYFYIGKDSPSLVLSLQFRIRIKPIPYYLSIFVNYLKKHIKFNQKEESTNYSICHFLFHTTVLYITHIPTFTGPDLEI